MLDETGLANDETRLTELPFKAVIQSNVHVQRMRREACLYKRRAQPRLLADQGVSALADVHMLLADVLMEQESFDVATEDYCTAIKLLSDAEQVTASHG